MIYIISTKERDVENILQTFNQERIKHKNVFSNDFQYTKHNMDSTFKSIQASFIIIICNKLYRKRIIIVKVNLQIIIYF